MMSPPVAQADRQPGIGRVQHPEDRAPTRAQRLPAPQPLGVQQGGGTQDRGGESLGRCQHPQRQADSRGGQRGLFQHARCLQLQAGQRRHREGRNHAAGDHALDHHHQCQPRMQGAHRVDVDQADHRAVKRCVGHGQQHQDRAQRQVAPVAGTQQHRDEDGRHQRQQQQVQCRVDGIGREYGRQPGGQPQPGQCGQHRAARRGQAGPGLARGEQETHDHGHGEAEQHFMGVPEHRGQRQVQRHLAQQQGDPQRHRQHAVGGGAQVEGAEAEPQQRPAPGCRRGGGVGGEGSGHGVGAGFVIDAGPRIG